MTLYITKGKLEQLILQCRIAYLEWWTAEVSIPNRHFCRSIRFQGGPGAPVRLTVLINVNLLLPYPGYGKG